MTILQNFQPMTRAKMTQLSLPDIRAYAKAYNVPADVIESGTVDELLDLIFKLRPRHPKRYPINTPHLFAHKIVRTQQECDEEFLDHKPYTGFTYRQNLARFRRAKSWIGRPFPPEGRFGQTEETTGKQHQPGEEPRRTPVCREDPLVMDQPVATSSMTPTYEHPNPLAEHPQAKLSPLPNPSHSMPSEVFNHDLSPALVTPLPSIDGPAPSRSEKGSTPQDRGADDRGSLQKMTKEEFIRKASRMDLPPPVSPALGSNVADDLSNLKSALEERQEAVESRPKPSHIIIDDKLFDLEFTPDMTQAGKEAVIRERYAIALSNHKMIEQILAEAEAEAKQVLWQLTTLTPQIDAAHENMQRFIDEFTALTGCRSLVRQVVFDSERMAKEAWELDWNEEWIFTKDDEKEEEAMKAIARARAAGVQLPPSPFAPVPPSPIQKRTRDEYEDELEYADEEDFRAGGHEPCPKRPRIESRETSATPSSPSPKGKGKGRGLVAEDSYTLPFPSSSFHIPPPPKPRFGPKDRCDIHPVYKPAVPGYQPSEAEDENKPGQYNGGYLSPSDKGGGYNHGPGPDQGGQVGGDNGGEVQIGEDGDEYEAGGTQEHSRNTSQIHQGAPPPAKAQPKGPRRGDPWQVLRYDRAVWEGYVVTDHTQMPSELKRPVNWSVMGPHHPKHASFREWDDVLEEQNPWHQGGRPILKQ